MWTLNPMESVLPKSLRLSDMRTFSEIGVIGLQARGGQGFLANTRKKEKVWSGFEVPSRSTNPESNLTWGFWPSEL